MWQTNKQIICLFVRYRSMLFKQRLVLHNFIINLSISNQFVATKCNGFLYCTADTQCWHFVNTKNVTVKDHHSRWAKNQSKSQVLCYSKLIWETAIHLQKIGSPIKTFFKQILDPLVFSFTSFIFVSVVNYQGRLQGGKNSFAINRFYVILWPMRKEMSCNCTTKLTLQ